MNEHIDKLVNNFISVANTRMYLFLALTVMLLAFDVIPKVMLFFLIVGVCVHAVMLVLINRSYQAHFITVSKLDRVVEILDYFSLGWFILFLLAASVALVFSL